MHLDDFSACWGHWGTLYVKVSIEDGNFAAPWLPDYADPYASLMASRLSVAMALAIVVNNGDGSLQYDCTDAIES